jgi:tRNA threonylcarbamoyladenosine biosynthesis protein TsaB
VVGGALTLALDAATYEGGVAVIRDGRVLAERTVAMRGETEERLMPAVLAALAEAGCTVREVGCVVCGEGPGSFTSLRIAGAIAKGVAFGNAVPLYAVSSLALVVAGAPDLAPGAYLAVLDAMRGERYVAPFVKAAAGAITVAGPMARVTAAEAAEVAARAGALAVGPLEATARAPHARGVAPLLPAILSTGAVSLDAWEPTYGRLAEAQVKWEAAHGRPLGG